MKADKAISVIIPVYNEEQYLASCLDSICASEISESYEIILVDNGSTDGTLDIAKKYPVEILSKPGVKVGAVRNYGVLQCSGDTIVFLDSDCVVDKKWLERGLGYIREGFDAVGGLYLLRERPSWIEKYWVLGGDAENAGVYQKTFVGGSIFIKRDVFERLGGFNVDLSAGEDSDLTSRLQDNSFKIAILPELNVIHLGFPNTVKSFIKRQVWHSGDAYQKLPVILLDKTFLLTHIFFFSFILFTLFLGFFGGGAPAAFFGLLWLVVPCAFSAKRLFRRKTRGYRLGEYVRIYIIDFFYLVGRVLGLFQSFKAFVQNRK